jgi:hypothetical protein
MLLLLLLLLEQTSRIVGRRPKVLVSSIKYSCWQNRWQWNSSKVFGEFQKEFQNAMKSPEQNNICIPRPDFHEIST